MVVCGDVPAHISTVFIRYGQGSRDEAGRRGRGIGKELKEEIKNCGDIKVREERQEGVWEHREGTNNYK